MIIPILQIRKQRLGWSHHLLKTHHWIWTHWHLVTESLPFPGFPLPPQLLLCSQTLGFSSYQDKELISRRKVPILEAESHDIRARTCTLRQLGVDLIGIIYQVWDCEPVPGPYWASQCFIIQIGTIILALQDNIMHNKASQVVQW